MSTETTTAQIVNEWIPIIKELIPLFTAGLMAYVAFSQRKVILNQNQMATTVQTLEKNTNSIHDALVKEATEAAKAKGVLQGKLEATEEHLRIKDMVQKSKE